MGQLIELCKAYGVLSRKAIELSAIVRAYRNLIHPGRVVRLSEHIDGNGATIAKSVVEIVVDETCGKKRETYGYTAEQLVRKMQQDASATSIAEHLLRETQPAEIRRLLLSVLPTAYIDSCNDAEGDPSGTVKEEYLWNEQMQTALEEMESIVDVPF